MKLEKLRENSLFKGLSQEEFTTIICTKKIQKIKSKVVLITPGQQVDGLYLIVEGKIEIYTYDLSGNKKIVAIFEGGELFGESVALAYKQQSPFFIATIEETQVFQLSNEEIFGDHFPKAILKNLLKLLATKNQFLTHRFECINKGSIEERVYEVLQYYRIHQGTNMVEIPFNKTQLAEYLCVNRSALSRELSKMMDKGIFKNSGKKYFLSEDYFK